jgi:hypothetical protein
VDKSVMIASAAETVSDGKEAGRDYIKPAMTAT